MKLTRETRIKKEIAKLDKIFSTVDSNTRVLVDSLINRAAYITISLEDLEEQLNISGWTEEYKNGENQYGVKKAAAADVHISLTKNLNMIMKQLLDLLPEDSGSDTFDI